VPSSENLTDLLEVGGIIPIPDSRFVRCLGKECQRWRRRQEGGFVFFVVHQSIYRYIFQMPAMRRIPQDLKFKKIGSKWQVYRRLYPNREIQIADNLSEQEAARFLESRTPRPQRRPGKIKGNRR
jgi:hypothetical protein